MKTYFKTDWFVYIYRAEASSIEIKILFPIHKVQLTLITVTIGISLRENSFFNYNLTMHELKMLFKPISTSYIDLASNTKIRYPYRMRMVFGKLRIPDSLYLLGVSAHSLDIV